MADKVIDSNVIVLKSNWGVSPIRVDDFPKDGIAGAEHFNVATAAFPLGTCIQVRHKGTAGVAGYSEFTYLKVGTQNSDVVLAVKLICGQDSASVPFTVTNDPDSTIGLAMNTCAVALGAMTDAYYGFFWTGGVCPEDHLSTLGGTYPTDDSVVVGFIKMVDLAADAIGFGTAMSTGTGASAVMSPPCGYSLTADVTGY